MRVSTRWARPSCSAKASRSIGLLLNLTDRTAFCTVYLATSRRSRASHTMHLPSWAPAAKILPWGLQSHIMPASANSFNDLQGW